MGHVCPTSVTHVEDVDMHAPDDEVPQAAIQLRADRFALMFAILGYKTDTEIRMVKNPRYWNAGYSRRTIYRARAGQLGEVFIANTIHVLRQHADELARYGLDPTMDELFVVVERRPAQQAA